MTTTDPQVDWGPVTGAQRDALTGLAAGDRGHALRGHHRRTRTSLVDRGLIEQRPAPLIPGYRLTATGQATVLARGWATHLVLRPDDQLDTC